MVAPSKANCVTGISVLDFIYKFSHHKKGKNSSQNCVAIEGENSFTDVCLVREEENNFF